MSKPAVVVYSLVTVALWAAALPAVLVVDAGGLEWRGPAMIGLGVITALTGTVLVWSGAAELSAAGVGLFGVGPGPVLVRSGIYSRLRNPIDVGTVLLAVAPWISLRSELMWVVPAAAVVWLLAGVGPYEDRRLLEEFSDEFRQYRADVSKWIPRR